MAAVATPLKISNDQLGRALHTLGQYVSIPSVSNKGSSDFDMRQLEAAANFATTRFEALDFTVEQIQVNSSAPYVVAKRVHSELAPTICLYAHYDVQPVERDKWDRGDPFTIFQRDGRLYGRGASDDKGGIVAILAALQALQEAKRFPPVNVTVFLEGEEEINSPNMIAFLQEHAAKINAKALVVMDGINKDVETGTLTSSTRGLVNLELEVQALPKPAHSGLACLVPDPAQVIAQLITALQNPREIPRFMDGAETLSEAERALLRQGSKSAAQYAQEYGVSQGVHLRGDPHESVDERIVGEPSISVVNLTCGVKDGGNSIQDLARCQIGIRLVPGQDPVAVREAVMDHLANQKTLWDTPVKVYRTGEGAHAWKADLTGKYTTLYLSALSQNFPKAGFSPCGGALPLLHKFSRQFPHMEMIVPGVEDPATAAHSHNESQDISVLRNSIDSLMAFLDAVGGVS